MTYTLPAGHKWTDTEAALRESHDREYELRMAFFWECVRLKAQVERLTEAGDAMVDMVEWEVPFERRKKLEADWNAAKEGKQP